MAFAVFSVAFLWVYRYFRVCAFEVMTLNVDVWMLMRSWSSAGPGLALGLPFIERAAVNIPGFSSADPTRKYNHSHTG